MVRRIVTGVDAQGAPTIVSDGEPPRSFASQHVAGSGSATVWATASPPRFTEDPTTAVTTYVPGPGETLALVVDFAPDSAFADPGIDFAAFGQEQAENSPGLAERFEPDGMHVTPTVDYGVVLEGEVVLDLDNGRSTVLKPGDIVVQNGTRHAWRNPGSAPARALFVLMGAAVDE